MNNFTKQSTTVRSWCLFMWLQSVIIKNNTFSSDTFQRTCQSSSVVCSLGVEFVDFQACDKRHFISTFRKTIFITTL